jgi:hypothetical protein
VALSINDARLRGIRDVLGLDTAASYLGGRLDRRVGGHSTGGVDVHGPSADSLTAEAGWTDRVDALSLPRWEDRLTNGIAFTTPIKPTKTSR